METIEIIKEKFNFLIKEYKFKIFKLNKKNNLIIYLSETVGVKISLEAREGYLSIEIYKLIGGILVENPIIIKPETKLNGYNFDDLLEIIDKSKIIEPLYTRNGINEKYKNKSNALEQYINDLANNLKTLGKSLILGNFELFQKANSIVKNRVFNLN